MVGHGEASTGIAETPGVIEDNSEVLIAGSGFLGHVDGEEDITRLVEVLGRVVQRTEFVQHEAEIVTTGCDPDTVTQREEGFTGFHETGDGFLGPTQVCEENRPIVAKGCSSRIAGPITEQLDRDVLICQRLRITPLPAQQPSALGTQTTRRDRVDGRVEGRELLTKRTQGVLAQRRGAFSDF